jgi:hypothetical protein
MVSEHQKSLREQAINILKRAQAYAGGREALAARLAVEPSVLAEWVAGQQDVPQPVLDSAVEYILEMLDAADGRTRK